MKIYLDDERKTPEGFVRVYWPDEAIKLLETGEVELISLDHDLGDDERGTGYDVLLWIEEQVYLNGFKAPEIIVHSSNSSARQKMELAIANIKKGGVMDKSRQQFEAFINYGDFPWLKASIPIMWMVWKASRESLEVELPQRKGICHNEYESGYFDGIDKCEDILISNGVKIKNG
ncbi:cyclic-phosphate processing receiver domain-containing protein [Providencia alcalifaciens]